MSTLPYLDFNGRCEEAIEFYRKAIGAKVDMMMRFKESPEPMSGDGCAGEAPPGDKIMHASMTIAGSVVMASDGYCTGAPKFEGIGLALSLPDEAAVKRAFDALADGGKVTMPLARTFWSPSFGMLTDRFGLVWMVMVEEQKQ